jgi:cytochrome c oxidase subunit 2
VEFRDAFQRMISFEGLVAGIVFVLVGVAVALALLLSRKRSGDTRRRSSHPIVEVGYAVVLAAIAGTIAFITASANNDLRAQVKPDAASVAPAATVDVDAFQWCWRFDYHQPDKSVTGSCAGQDTDVPTLVVPTGVPVRLNITSSDVQHSFWIPDLRVKVDAFPDHTNTATLTFDHEGQWSGRCAEFCGSYHTEMHFWVRAVSPQQYQQWLAQGGQA